jgi:prepilin-type N-terminal cleavage/methylation domain-containing protein
MPPSPLRPRAERCQFPASSSSRSGGRSGFTLIELMVALMLTSVVALAAYAAAHLSLETRARVGEDLAVIQSTRVLREVLQDALRNARAPQRPEDTTFGLAGGRLSFIAAGAGPPFDPDYDWRITVEADSAGLQLVGVPVGRAPAVRMAIRAPGVTRCDVRVLLPDGSKWISEWLWPTVMPRAIAVTLLHRDAPVGPPLEVTLTPQYTSGMEGTNAIR